jgi:hypothetical protein
VARISGLSNELSQEWAYNVGYGKAPGFRTASSAPSTRRSSPISWKILRTIAAGRILTNKPPTPPRPRRTAERQGADRSRRPRFDPFVRKYSRTDPFFEASPFYDEKWWDGDVWPRPKPDFDGYDPMPRLKVPSAVEIGARYTREWFHQHPGAFSVPFGVNDHRASLAPRRPRVGIRDRQCGPIT